MLYLYGVEQATTKEKFNVDETKEKFKAEIFRYFLQRSDSNWFKTKNTI